MALLLPAIQGKLGDVTYYALTMKARELVEKVIIPSEQPDWTHQELDQYFQRDINYSRVKSKVAPYFSENPSRFSSSIVVALHELEKNTSFSPLMGGVNQIGVLTIDGGCELLPIDGQHRVLAIKYAISGRDNNGEPLRDMAPNQELAKEDVPVILVDFKIDKVRAIFSAVNEHAKRTTTSENIVVGKELIKKLTRDVASRIFTVRLVKRDGKVLNLEDHRIATLSSIANCSKDLFDAIFPDIRKEKGQPAQGMGWEYETILEAMEDHWHSVINNTDFYKAALEETGEPGDDKRISLKKDWLISRAMVQECLFKAFAMLIAEDGHFYAKPDEAAQALNKLPLRTNDIAVWQPFLFSNDGKIGNKNKKFTAEFMTYLVIGDEYHRKDKLAADYAKFLPGRALPPPLK